MGAIYERFKVRVAEVEHYFSLLKAMETDVAPNRARWKDGRKALPRVLVNDLSLKLMRAQSYLLLYNLVEATVRDSVDSVWEDIRLSQVSLSDLRPALRDEWVGHEFRKAGSAHDMSGAKYRKRAVELIERVVAGEMLQVTFRNVGGGGNIDHHAVNAFCKKYGIDFSAPKGSRAGVDLEVVKAKRNILAHGEQSFEEVGRSATVTDLVDVKLRLVSYMRQYVRRVERCVVIKGYKVA